MGSKMHENYEQTGSCSSRIGNFITTLHESKRYGIVMVPTVLGRDQEMAIRLTALMLLEQVDPELGPVTDLPLDWQPEQGSRLRDDAENLVRFFEVKQQEVLETWARQRDNELRQTAQQKALETLHRGFDEIRDAVNRRSLDRVMDLAIALRRIPGAMGSVEQGGPCDDALLASLIAKASATLSDGGWRNPEVMPLMARFRNWIRAIGTSIIKNNRD